jgi:LmbE family N-acetylglucosaminyl deacetylase
MSRSFQLAQAMPSGPRTRTQVRPEAGPQPPAARRVFNVISPHLDDGALSCSLLLAAHPGSCFTTIFAGGPLRTYPLTPWDKAARYFPEGANIVGVRRGEDISAAAMVSASTVHLPYWDRQYRNDQYGYRGPTDDELTAAIAEDLLTLAGEHQRHSWVIPLGLRHPDHRIAAQAALIFAARQPGDIYVYEELPYTAENPAEVAARKAFLAERGFALRADAAIAFPNDRALKAAVLGCHASQRHTLGKRLRTAVRTPERIWSLLTTELA